MNTNDSVYSPGSTDCDLSEAYITRTWLADSRQWCSTWCDFPHIKTVTLEQNKFGPSNWTDVGTEFHSLKAFKKNEL